MTAQEEIKIIKKCRQGKLNQFELLYEAYIRKIYDFTFYKTFNKELAQDITGQTFLTALEKIRQFDSKKGNFSAWIFQIAKNLIIDHYRARKPDLSIDDVWDLESDQDVEEEAELRLKYRKARSILKKLKPEQRDIIILRIWHDLPYKEIAEITKKSEASCKMLFARSIKKLQKEEITTILLILTLLLR